MTRSLEMSSVGIECKRPCIQWQSPKWLSAQHEFLGRNWSCSVLCSCRLYDRSISRSYTAHGLSGWRRNTIGTVITSSSRHKCCDENSRKQEAPGGAFLLFKHSGLMFLIPGDLIGINSMLRCEAARETMLWSMWSWSRGTKDCSGGWDPGGATMEERANVLV